VLWDRIHAFSGACDFQRSAPTNLFGDTGDILIKSIRFYQSAELCETAIDKTYSALVALERSSATNLWEH
jgi:hypothetical protein